MIPNQFTIKIHFIFNLIIFILCSKYLYFLSIIDKLDILKHDILELHS